MPQSNSCFIWFWFFLVIAVYILEVGFALYFRKIFFVNFYMYIFSVMLCKNRSQRYQYLCMKQLF